ncbi:MAG: helix-turn-helix transcriptional regulator [Firmicutes bacterium]|nr:helix-turn-helix transcriptional regulator [Bacillota bacterium]
MSFADNLQIIRKNSNLTQEELANVLNVSRQEVSSWEQGNSYPEVETLLQLSKTLHTSLDLLLSGEPDEKNLKTDANLKNILISSPNERVTVMCTKVSALHILKATEEEPKYALFGISGTPVWGCDSTLIGWYADQADIMAEVGEISKAMITGEHLYELKYSVKTIRSFMKVNDISVGKLFQRK